MRRLRFIPDEVVQRMREQDPEVSAAIDAVYNELEQDGMLETVEEYHNRHMTSSLGVVTVSSRADARRLIKPFRQQLLGKTVVEIGAGIGYFALELARYCPQVFAIESDPAWSWIFAKHLYDKKPSHLTWIFGRAEEVARWLRADIALIVTRSGHEEMENVARRMAPVVIDVYRVLEV